jgi:mevalonate kinase
MPAISAYAPGKIILCGEHAVVYGTPAIALPVTQVSTRTSIFAHPISPAGEVRITAPSVGLDGTLDLLSNQHPLRAAILLVEEELGITTLPACEIHITTTIPLAAGLGSSASVTVSLVRALSQFLGHPFSDELVNKIAFEVEKIHHGTPSGIDNTVITYQTPVFFRKGFPIEHLDILNEFTLVITDSGTASSTVKTVAGVRERWLQDSKTYDGYFSQIGALTNRICQVLRSGNLTENGSLLTENHELLRSIGVSTTLLDRLVASALDAGATGAKLSGGGGGGNVIAIVDPSFVSDVAQALTSCGSVRTIITTIPGTMGMKQ